MKFGGLNENYVPCQALWNKNNTEMLTFHYIISSGFDKL